MKQVFLAGHNGMVGSALLKRLQRNNSINIITASRSELDLTNQREVNTFFDRHSIDHVYLAAAKVGGILANNSLAADFIYENLMIEANVINASHRSGVERLMFLGSSCIYPRSACQPIKENSLLTDKLELTNEPYAIAKIAGIKLCESYHRQYGRDFRSIMPTNLYGPGDNFDELTSHVLPGLIARIHDAKVTGKPTVTIWGSGKPRREFLHVDDLADATVKLMELTPDFYWSHVEEQLSHVNVGYGEDITISELALLIAKFVGYTGKFVYDTSMPDGTPQKLLDCTLIHDLGWRPSITLKEGVQQTYETYKNRALNAGL